MTKKEIIRYAIIGIAIVAALALLFTVFNGIKKRSDSAYRLAEKALDRAFQADQQVIDMKTRENEELKKKNEELERRDSTWLVNYQQHQKVYTNLNEELKNIPIRIARIANNDDSIRAAFARP